MIIFNCLSFIQSLECLKVLTMSSWNPPPGNRKMHGDLMYLNVVTMEDRHFSITASTRGFYVNQWVTMYSCPSKCPCPTRKTNTYNLFSFHFFFYLDPWLTALIQSQPILVPSVMLCWIFWVISVQFLRRTSVPCWKGGMTVFRTSEKSTTNCAKVWVLCQYFTQ